MARDFNGLTDRIDWATIYNPVGSAFTFSTWFVVDTWTVNMRILMMHAAGDAAAGLICYLTTPLALVFQVQGTTNLVRRTADNSFAAGALTHLLVTWDGSTTATNVRIYKNGTEVAYLTTTNGATLGAVGGSWSLGGQIYSDDRNLDGRLAEPAVWNRILTNGEIGALAKRLAPHALPSLLKFAPRLVRGANDPVSGKIANLDGTAIADHPPIIYPTNLLTPRGIPAPPTTTPAPTTTTPAPTTTIPVTTTTIPPTTTTVPVTTTPLPTTTTLPPTTTTLPPTTTTLPPTTTVPVTTTTPLATTTTGAPTTTVPPTTTAGPTTTTPVPVERRLYLSALMRAVYEHLTADAPLMALVTGGIHDTLAAADTPCPYLVLTIVDATDESTFTGSAISWLRLQTDLYDEGQGAVGIEACSRRLNEVLDRPVIVDAAADYWPFRLQAEEMRKLKEAPDIWRISQDFVGIVHRRAA